MNIFNLWNTVYQAEAEGEAGSAAAAAAEGGKEGGEGEGEGGGKERSLLESSNPTLEDGEWFQSEGIKGTGDKPEWYEAEHFKSVNEQAKGYSELQKQFGSFTGVPKEGYKLPEGIEADDELAKAYIEFATNSKMNQEGFDKGFELLSAQMGVSEEISEKVELDKLGDNASQRIKMVENALRFKAGDGYGEIKDLITTADGVILAEKLIKIFAPAKLPMDGGENPTGVTWEEIEKLMYEKTKNGQYRRSIDTDFDNKIKRMQKEWGGDKPKVEIVG